MNYDNHPRAEINLSRMIFQSQPNDFPTTAERNDVWLKDAGTSFSP